jgi:hypothetical protein
MPHWSAPNKTSTDRRVLFAVYNARSLGDYHARYYEHEAQNRRRDGTGVLSGKANRYFNGDAATAEEQATTLSASIVGTTSAAASDGVGADSGRATLAQKEATLAEIVALYSDKSQYGSVSQLKHGCQAAQQAIDAGADDDTVVAALLHDIGWKLARCIVLPLHSTPLLVHPSTHSPTHSSTHPITTKQPFAQGPALSHAHRDIHSFTLFNHSPALNVRHVPSPLL